MYLHLGNDVIVRKKEVLAIFDLDNTTWSHRSRAFLSQAEKEGKVFDAAGGELPKSFVLCDGPKGTRVYLSQRNSSTLSRRAEETEFL